MYGLEGKRSGGPGGYLDRHHEGLCVSQSFFFIQKITEPSKNFHKRSDKFNIL